MTSKPLSTPRDDGSRFTPSVPLACPDHGLLLHPDHSSPAESFVCPSGCTFPIRNGIPRFVPADPYASSFGLQWNKFRTTQLDSFTGTTISRDRLTRLMGGDLAIVKAKTVLEAGCGAGRFTELLLQAGAKVFAVDLSSAVEANNQNCKKYTDYFVCQADITKIPVEPGKFDIVVCVGVVQHTPNPEETMTRLCSYVKPGGLLVMDHYTHGYPSTPVRRILRSFLLRKSPDFSMRFCRIMISILWPLHWAFAKGRKIRALARIRSHFLLISPVVDYHDAYGQLGSKLLRQWAFLDTHDTLTDFYKHLRSADEIQPNCRPAEWMK